MTNTVTNNAPATKTQSSGLISGQKSPELLDYLLRRRSVPLKMMAEPGPDKNQITQILQTATRTPDHGKMFPWYFIVFDGEARLLAGTLLEQAFKEENPDAAPAKLELERERFMRAPLVIAVVSRIREGKHPQWEQILSAGAVCQNLSLAANALGFGTNWLTEWYAYNDSFRKGLGLDEQDHIAGFIYIGTPKEEPEERDRPDLAEIVTNWEPGCTVKKGADYGHPGKGLPRHGFRLPRPAEDNPN